MLENVLKNDVFTKSVEMAYRLEGIAKTRVPRVQKGAQNDAKSVKKYGYGR